MADRVKVTILGGGCGAVATAWALSSTAELRARYQIDLYQMGWRIGGKGASGRNMTPGLGHRIEEHGLHVWAGFYDNAFNVMKACYEACASDGIDGVFKSFEDAFKPHDSISMQSNINESWINKTLSWPTNNKPPGTNSDQTMKQLVIALIKYWHEFFSNYPPGISKEQFDSFNTLVTPDLSSGRDFLDWLIKELEKLIDDSGALDPLASCIKEFADRIQDYISNTEDVDDNVVIWGRMVCLVAYILVGLIKEEVLSKGFDSINHYDLKEFIGNYGANEDTLSSTVIRGGYDYVFGFMEGDLEQPSLAAGVGLAGALLVFFDYKGSILWKMQAGMGDTIFTPLHKVLEARGVNFHFFNKVKQLHVTDGTISSITMNRQAEVINEPYKPYVRVGELDCWPSVPFYDQLKEGDKIKDQKVNLESFWNDWPGTDYTLTAGIDYDEIVLGISIGSFPYLCNELESNADWANMVNNVKTVRTFGTQLWMDPTLKDLGFLFGSTIATSYIESLSTWADMSNLLTQEDWPEQGAPQQISYFCGTFPDDPNQPPSPDPAYPPTQLEQVNSNSIEWIKEHMVHFWWTAESNDVFWSDFLHDPNNGTGDARFDSQFYRVNIDPSERYVLSNAGSIQYRLESDAMPFDNLFLSGDWVKTRVSAGCVEAAMEGGLNAAKGLIAKTDTKLGENLANQVTILSQEATL